MVVSVIVVAVAVFVVVMPVVILVPVDYGWLAQCVCFPPFLMRITRPGSCFAC